MNKSHATVVINDPNHFFSAGLMHCIRDAYSAAGFTVSFTDHIFNHRSKLIFLTSDILSAAHAHHLNHHMTIRQLQIFTIYNTPLEKEKHATNYNKLNYCIPLYRTQSVKEISATVRHYINAPSNLRDILVQPCSKRPEQSFTRRETEILRYLARGISNGAVARFLQISEKTVSAHKRNIMSKLNMIRPAELNYWLLQEGWCESWRTREK